MSATKELDDLMASISDLDIQVSAHCYELQYILVGCRCSEILISCMCLFHQKLSVRYFPFNDMCT